MAYTGKLYPKRVLLCQNSIWEPWGRASCIELCEPPLINRNQMVANKDKGEDNGLGLISSYCPRKEPVLLPSVCPNISLGKEPRPDPSEHQKLSLMGGWRRRKNVTSTFPFPQNKSFNQSRLVHQSLESHLKELQSTKIMSNVNHLMMKQFQM